MKERGLLSSWKFWVIAFAAAGAVWVTGFLWSRAYDPDRILAEPRGPNGELTTSQVERLYLCFSSDMANGNRRARYRLGRGPDAARVAFERVLVAIFPDRGTNAKVAHEGRTALTQLRKAALDPRNPPLMQHWAAFMSAIIDPYGTLTLFKQPILSGQLPRAVVSMIKSQCLPPYYVPKTPNPEKPLISDLSSKTLDEVYMERLDETVAKVQTPGDRMVIRWLNRYHGVDFDEWLAKNAPEVLAFRNRELERGYDPATPWFTLFLNKVWSEHEEIDEGLLQKIYPAKGDRKAMSRLWCICHDDATGNDDKGDWHATLTAWYAANRSRLVYDPKVMHFVVGPTPVRPEVKLESTDTVAPR